MMMIIIIIIIIIVVDGLRIIKALQSDVTFARRLQMFALPVTMHSFVTYSWFQLDIRVHYYYYYYYYYYSVINTLC